MLAKLFPNGFTSCNVYFIICINIGLSMDSIFCEEGFSRTNKRSLSYSSDLGASVKRSISQRTELSGVVNDLRDKGIQYRQNVSPQLIVKVIGAIERTVGYYEKHYTLLNFDGIFGAKVVEGQLNLVVAEYSKGFLSQIMDDTLKNDVARIAARAGHIVKMAIPHLHTQDPEHLSRMRRLFYLSWDIGHSHRMVDLRLKWSDEMRLQSLGDAFNESESNQCLAELLEPVNGMMCRMSDNCQHVMTKPGMEKYILNHQILYSIVAEMSGCGSRLEQWLVKRKRSESLEQLQGEMCSNLYSEALALAATTFNDNITTFRDLVLEMEFVCGMLGYVEFLRKDWLVGIFEWQSPSGCFKITKQHLTVGRKLLEEEKLPDGCLSHLTTVAVSALAVHLHYLLNPRPLNTIEKSVNVPVVSPARSLQPPPPNSFPLNSAPEDVFNVFNRPLFRGDLEKGATGYRIDRVQDNDKSLEDKADIVIKNLYEEKANHEALPRGTSVESDTRKQHLIPPEQSLPFAQYLASTNQNKIPLGYSMIPFYFVVTSMILVMLAMVRFAYTKRRPHLLFRSRFRFV